MQIELLKEDELEEFSDATNDVISNTKYYPDESKKEQIEFFNPSAVKDKMASKDNIIVVAKEDGKIIGFCYGYYEPGGAFLIFWIGVRKNARGKEVAKKMLEYVEKMAKSRKVHKLYCDIMVDNKESIAFFTKMGFKRRAELKNYWFNLDFYWYDKEI